MKAHRFLTAAALGLGLIILLAVPAVIAGPPATGEIPTRDQIEEKYKWDLTDIYRDQAAWEKDFKRMEGVIAVLPRKYKGKLVSSPEVLYTPREDPSRTGVEFGLIIVSAHQPLHQDGNVPASQDMSKRAIGLAAKFGEATSWMEPEILANPEETLRSWYQDRPGLALYEHHLDNIIRGKAHTLDARGEELLAMTGQMSSAANQA